MNVGTKIEFAGQEAMATTVARQKRDFAAFQRATYIGVGRGAERRLHPHFFDPGQPGHRVEPAAADDSDFRLCQSPSRRRARTRVKPVIIQEGETATGEKRGGSGATI